MHNLSSYVGQILSYLRFNLTRLLVKKRLLCFVCQDPSTGIEGKIIYWSKSGLIVLQTEDGTSIPVDVFPDTFRLLFCKRCKKRRTLLDTN